MKAFAKIASRSVSTLAALGLASCLYLPQPGEPLPAEFAAPPAESGILAEIEQKIAAEHSPLHSGFHVLDRSADALTWRLALLDSAEKTLDIVYYLWFGHETGRLMLERVLKAADRGVKVRLLVDDILMIGKDRALVMLDSHPYVELRLFNPKRQRRLGMATDFLIRFGQTNSRMHNKLIVADNRAAILGGRNIGNEYFGLDEHFNFHDLDVLGFGPVARESSSLFDNFWNSEWSVPVSLMKLEVDSEDVAARRVSMENDLHGATLLASFDVEPQDWRARLEALSNSLHPGIGKVIHDRMEGDEIVRGMVAPLREVLRTADEEIRVVNAYVIPNEGFIEGVQRLTGRGIEVGILTNSLASHDTPAVNAHYKKWRKPLVEAGVELFELRSDPAIRNRIQTPPVTMKYAGLHSKTLVIDRKRVFIGSFNFDPRSADINTEMGVIIDSPGVAAELADIYERDIAPENAWQVLLDDDGDLFWKNSDQTVTRQPARSTWQRVQDVLFMALPVSQF
jgi:putative cardiolipin synthase